MKSERRTLSFSLMTALALVASSCSSSLKEYNPKMGLLDEMALLEPANHAGSVGYARAGAPAAVAVEEIGAPRSSIGNVALRWPLQEVQITSPYGQRGREFHEGVDLRAKLGTPVYSAHAGQVLYANDGIHGYGKMIVLRHSSGLATIYAHNSKLLIRKGQWVSKGTLIAYTGNTGHSSGPHLHFEVREGVSTVNPLSLLPRQKVVAEAYLDDAGRLVAKGD